MAQTRSLDVEVTVAGEARGLAFEHRLHLGACNLWRDLWPVDLADGLATAREGDELVREAGPGTLVPQVDRGQVFAIGQERFRRSMPGVDGEVTPRRGRFYPRALVPGVGDSVAGDRRILRVTERTEAGLTVDFNHPLAGLPLTLRLRLLRLSDTRGEQGGSCRDVGGLAAADGPGMALPLPGAATDYCGAEGYRRQDETDDRAFYGRPRLVPHLDDVAHRVLVDLYRRLLPEAGRVLDLMSSWQSHLPQGFVVSGLGMNEEEMAHNPQLADFLEHDLNRNPVLPFDDSSFDAVVCTASVEYLVQPVVVLGEVVRVLRPGGVFAAGFSHRWFPPKAIAVWGLLHPFERLGLVAQWCAAAGLGEVRLTSVQGLPRPAGDRYHGRLAHADPVFVVSGRRLA